MSDPTDIEARIAALERKVSDLYHGLGRREPGGSPSGAGSDPPGGEAVAPGEDPWIVDLVAAGRKIEAVRAYQKASGVGLKEAKRAVDRLEVLHRPGARG